MTASAWDGWCKLHINPFAAMGYLFGFSGLSKVFVCYCAVGIQGDDFIENVITVMAGIHIVFLLALDILFWRWGPGVVCHKLYPTLLLSLVLTGVPLMLLGSLGPEELVPWDSRIHFLIFSSLWMFMELQEGAAGLVPGEHPAEPRTSIMMPFATCCVRAVMMIDLWSDLTLIRSLVRAVCSSLVLFWLGCSMILKVTPLHVL